MKYERLKSSSVLHALHSERDYCSGRLSPVDSKIKVSFKQQLGLIAEVSVKIKSNRSCTKAQADLFCTKSETCTRELWGLSGAKLSKAV